MSILTELKRIEDAKSSLVNTAKEWELINDTEASNIKIDTVADKYEAVAVHPMTPVEIEEGNAETFSAGYYPNDFIVTAKSGTIRPGETPGTATAGDILSGETAWVNGVKITGTMPDKGNVVIRLYTDSGAYDVPEGYHAGGGSVSVAAEAGTYTIKATDLENTTFVIDPGQAGTSSPNYYLTGVTVNTSAIETRLAAI